MRETATIITPPFLTVAAQLRQGSFALDADFVIEQGGFILLTGPSGSGKTTLLRILAGLQQIEAGSIALEGRSLALGSKSRVPPHRRGVGYIFQEPRLFPHLSVRANLLYGRLFSRPRAREAPPALSTLVDLLDLEPLLHRAPRHLSGGEAQRVAIGRALLARPRLLLMDEPLSAQDERRKADILPYLGRLRQQGVPIVYVTHHPEEAESLATERLYAAAGHIRAYK
jgi:molybdate transport system ATP-binding protein